MTAVDGFTDSVEAVSAVQHRKTGSENK